MQRRRPYSNQEFVSEFYASLGMGQRSVKTVGEEVASHSVHHRSSRDYKSDDEWPLSETGVNATLILNMYMTGIPSWISLPCFFLVTHSHPTEIFCFLIFHWTSILKVGCTAAVVICNLWEQPLHCLCRSVVTRKCFALSFANAAYDDA